MPQAPIKVDYASCQKMARAAFPADQFVLRQNVCQFAEHDTEDDEGQAQHYGREQLQQIVDRCNERIADTGDFAPITEGHTPTPEQVAAGAKQPAILGYSGPFRLGKIGRLKPRWAIFADERYYRDAADKVKRLPRRSVELWMHDDMRQRYFDPIAALGAEAPRLDLGLHYASHNGQTVVKYSAVAPAGGNTFIQDFDKEGTAMPLGDEGIREVLDALFSTDEFQWLKSKMEQETATATEEAPADTEVDEYPLDEDTENYMGGHEYMGDEMPDDMSEEYMCDQDKEREKQIGDMSAEYALDADKARKKCLYSQGSKMTVNQFSKWIEDVPKKVPRRERREPADQAQRYQRLESEHQKLSKAHYAMQRRMQKLERERSDAIRQAQLVELDSEYVIELEDERKRCLYSLGSSMDDKQFADHVQTIQRYGRERPEGQSIPAGEVAPPRRPHAQRTERYERDLSQKAIQYAKQRRKEGKDVTADEAYAWAEEQLTQANGN